MHYWIESRKKVMGWITFLRKQEREVIKTLSREQTLQQKSGDFRHWWLRGVGSNEERPWPRQLWIKLKIFFILGDMKKKLTSIGE